MWDENSDFARIYIGGAIPPIRHLYKPCAFTVASVVEVCVFISSIKTHFISSFAIHKKISNKSKSNLNGKNNANKNKRNSKSIVSKEMFSLFETP